MHIEYPKMLYLDGKLDAPNVIVADAGEEAHAKTQGYIRYGSKTAEAKPAAPDNKQDPKIPSAAPKRGRPAKAK